MHSMSSGNPHTCTQSNSLPVFPNLLNPVFPRHLPPSDLIFVPGTSRYIPCGRHGQSHEGYSTFMQSPS